MNQLPGKQCDPQVVERRRLVLQTAAAIAGEQLKW